MKLGIIITGTQGSGKSTLVSRLCSIDKRYACVRAVTTRQRRRDDPRKQYDYVSKKRFLSMAQRNQLLVDTEYGGSKYGVRHRDFDVVAKSGKIPILVLAPESAYQLDGIVESQDGGLLRIPQFISIFVDAPDEVLDARLRSRGENSDTEYLRNQRIKDRKYARHFLCSIGNMDLDKSSRLVRMLYDQSSVGGVLPGRTISLMLDCNTLMEGATQENVSGASYDLSLGDEYYYGGNIHGLNAADPILSIEPYDYAIVTSREIANFPLNISARFDLSVKLFCQGIILSNGPQVDPGFQGPLFCLLFNTSSSRVQLKRGQHYATIEFHTLIEPTFPYRGRYRGKSLVDYLPDNAAHGAISLLQQQLEKVRVDTERAIGEVSSQSRTYYHWTLALLTLAIAVLAIIVGSWFGWLLGLFHPAVSAPTPITNSSLLSRTITQLLLNRS